MCLAQERKLHARIHKIAPHIHSPKGLSGTFQADRLGQSNPVFCRESQSLPLDEFLR